jgi:hypothetical protein
VGVPEPEQSIGQLEKEIGVRISPPLHCTLDVHETGGKKILRVLIPRGDDPPYAVDDNKIYIRSEAETGLAVRDEIVGLVLRSPRRSAAADKPSEAFTEQVRSAPAVEVVTPALGPVVDDEARAAPRTGVEIVSVEERDGARYFTMRDLRNGNVVKNVTRTSARRLWHYAITTYSELPPDLSQAGVQWQGSLGMLNRHKQGKIVRYDLVRRASDGNHFYFGVTDDGIHGAWRQLVGQEDD